MLLSDGEIKEAIANGDLAFDPPLEGEAIQPASIDLRLAPTIRVQSELPVLGVTLDPEALDVTRHIEAYTELKDLSGDGPWRLEPGRFIIGYTLERVSLPFHLGGRVEGRSRLARLGVGVHITAPKIDPGFHNQIALEIFNLGPWTIELKEGMRICTLLVEQLGRPAEVGYSGTFQGR